VRRQHDGRLAVSRDRGLTHKNTFSALSHRNLFIKPSTHPITSNEPYHSRSITTTAIMSGNDNPGNFANRSKDDVKAAASKGGKTGTENSGFASMDKDKVVRPHSPLLDNRVVIYILQY